ncbi:MAG: DUF5036 family protein [Sodaliphilus sp.]
MKVSNCVHLLAAFALTIAMASCDEPPLFDDPDDMVVLNMMDEDHGFTLMGETDIHITRDLNFISEQYRFIEVPKAQSLGHVEENEPNLATLTDKAAVEQYSGYLAIRQGDVVRFPSGKVAVIVDRPYYRMWVDDFIKDSAKKKVGAIVNFAQYMPERNGLPNVYTEVGAVPQDGKLLVSVPSKECEAMVAEAESAYFECTLVNSGKKSTDFEVRLRPGALQQMPAEIQNGTFHLYVRNARACTILNFQLCPA